MLGTTRDSCSVLAFLIKLKEACTVCPELLAEKKAFSVFDFQCARYTSANGRSLGFLHPNSEALTPQVSVWPGRAGLVNYETRSVIGFLVHNSRLRGTRTKWPHVLIIREVLGDATFLRDEFDTPASS